MAKSASKTLRVEARARELQESEGLSPLIAEACAGIDAFLEASKSSESLEGLCTVRTRMKIEAVYEQGVLRPDHPIELAEGSRVEIIVLPATSPQSGDGGSARKRRSAEIAALPIESNLD